MPSYEFVCVSCEKSDTVFIRMSQVDSWRVICDCGAEMKRSLRIQGVSFKGDGFAANDKK